MKAAASLSEVIAQQDAIINWCRINENRVGYFAMLYRRMTQQVQDAAISGQFNDPERMERLMVNFANFYLQAWYGYTKKITIGNAWQQVFTYAEKNNLVVL